MSDNKATSQFTPCFVLLAEGGRIGLSTCRQCGATVMFGDDECDGPTIHLLTCRGRERVDKLAAALRQLLYAGSVAATSFELGATVTENSGSEQRAR